MTDPGPGKRSYDSSGRRARAERTRAEVVEAARRLFLENGYAATAVTDVARAASVSPETIYKAFASKGALLSAVVRAAVRGDVGDTPLRDRARIEAIRAEPDAARQLDLYGALLADVNPRLAPVFALMREAAPAHPEIAQELARLNDDRLQGMSEFAGLLERRGALGGGVSRGEARDVLWTLNSPELYELMAARRGWSDRRYGRWIADALKAALLA
jgi:AcrR family transcriptional regulator